MFLLHSTIRWHNKKIKKEVGLGENYYVSLFTYNFPEILGIQIFTLKAFRHLRIDLGGV